MPALIRWIVRPNAFPFGVSAAVLGYVEAPDREAAQTAAEVTHGAGVVVERATGGPDKGGFRPMTRDEQRVARALVRVVFTTGTDHRTFARAMHAQCFHPQPMITDQQAAKLRRLAKHYEKQLAEPDRQYVAALG